VNFNYPDPEHLVVTSPQREGFSRQITKGMMEKWNIEFCGSKAGVGLILLFDLCHSNKIDIIPPNPLFQHSSVPTCPAEVTPRRDEGG